MSIAALIQAAEYIERQEREREHGYASRRPPCVETRCPAKRGKGRKSPNSRTTHNELEKNRRAHLRECLEQLKDLVPLGPEATRHTTLGLLTKAKRFIKTLEDRDKRHICHKEQLAREQRYLRRRLATLHAHFLGTEVECLLTYKHCFRADSIVSMASSSGVSTGRSPSSVSESASSKNKTGKAPRFGKPYYDDESDEIDVIGYTSNPSDSDSMISVRSGDSGVAVLRAPLKRAQRTTRV